VTLASERPSGPFTTRWYNDPVEDDASASGRTVPVWTIAPQSVIVAPAVDTIVKTGEAIEVWGWAWADGGVSQVDVSVDTGEWQRAQLEPLSQRAWQRFTLPWMPIKRGSTILASRAATSSGKCQPVSGRRNAIHSVSVNVT
jgi:hypothetical protein